MANGFRMPRAKKEKRGRNTSLRGSSSGSNTMGGTGRKKKKKR